MENSSLTIGSIIQARMASSRLPNKVMKDIHGQPMLHWVVERTKLSEFTGSVIVAFPESSADNSIHEYCKKHNEVEYYRGSENDVLKRYYHAAKKFELDVISRITADCPLLDPDAIDKVIKEFLNTNCDIASNHIPPSYPDGLDVEVFSMQLLKELHQKTFLPTEREHVTTYVHKYPEKFQQSMVQNDKDLSKKRWTVDRQEDLEFIRKIYDKLEDPLAGMDAVLKILEENPQLENINKHLRRDDGYRGKTHELIPGGAHTYSKGDDQFADNVPRLIERGKGAYIHTRKGKQYLDLNMGLTSSILGHAYEPVQEAVRRELQKGLNFPRPAAIELEFAEMLDDLFPWFDMFKFAKNGSTVTTAAVKLARAYTGRDKIAICADHAFFSYDDWFVGTTVMDRGIPQPYKELSVQFPYGDLKSTEEIFKESGNDIAAVILEPVTASSSPPENYLQNLQELCHKYGIVMILDEIVTGFKLGLRGAQERFDVKPDLATFGKSIANGFSVDLLAGKKEIMRLGGLDHDEERVFLVSTTNGAETTGIAAAIKTIQEIRDKNVIEYRRKFGNKLKKTLNGLIHSKGLEDNFRVQGYPELLLLKTQDEHGDQYLELKTLLQQELAAENIIYKGFLMHSFSHKEQEFTKIINGFDQALSKCKDALETQSVTEKLQGEPIKPVFRKYN